MHLSYTHLNERDHKKNFSHSRRHDWAYSALLNSNLYYHRYLWSACEADIANLDKFCSFKNLYHSLNDLLPNQILFFLTFIK